MPRLSKYKFARVTLFVVMGWLLSCPVNAQDLDVYDATSFQLLRTVPKPHD